MTTAPLKHALHQQAETVSWLQTAQAARMARIDEQVRGESAGLTPGSDDPEPLKQWITTTYGNLPAITAHSDIPEVDQQAARVRHWQASRLSSSTLLLVNSLPQTVAHNLARTGGFPTTPELPSFLNTTALTLVWPTNYDAAGSHHVVGPGGLPGENRCCAITIDQTHQRIIEWSPAPALADLGADLARMTRQAGGSLPPWLLSGDTRYEPTVESVENHRAAIMAAADTPPDPSSPTLVEEANAVLAGILAGLFVVKSHPVDDHQVLTLAAP